MKNNWKQIRKIDTHVHVTYRKMIGSDIRYNPPKRYLEVMKENNIQKAIVVPNNYLWYHAKMSMGEDGAKCLRYNNDVQAKIAKESKRLICFADLNFHETDSQFVMKELERAIFDLKLKGIKIHCRNNGIKGNHKVYYYVLLFAKKHNLPVVIHSAPIKGYKDKWSNPKYFAEVLTKVKYNRVLISHMGGNDWRYLKKIDCYFDFSFATTPLWTKLGYLGLEKAIRYIGISRCCFASDYFTVNYSPYYKYLNKINFDDSELKMIAEDNARRFLDSL